MSHKRQRQSKDPGISPAGAFYTHRLVARLRQIGRRAASKLLYAHFARRSFGTPPCPPLSGLAASALPRAGAVFMQDWYFSEAVAMFPNARVMATMARRLEAPPVPSLIW